MSLTIRIRPRFLAIRVIIPVTVQSRRPADEGPAFPHHVDACHEVAGYVKDPEHPHYMEPYIQPHNGGHHT